MSHLQIKRVSENDITAPDFNYVRVFSNIDEDGKLYYKDESDEAFPVGGDIEIIETTYLELYDLYTNQNFATGSYYLITDFDSIYEQLDFYCDGTLKSDLETKGRPAGWSYQPILIMATSYKDLSTDAYQPSLGAGGYIGFPKDKIKYDITWRNTELGNYAKGRITERIDEYGNRTDYDHRTIRFKRYQNYDRTDLISTISYYDCVTGGVTGSSFSFLSSGDVILLDTEADLGYTIGFKVGSIINDTNMTVLVDSLYVSGVPTNVTLGNSAQIVPVDYSFTGKSYDYYTSTPTSDYCEYKEVYFGQSDEDDYEEYYTFASESYNNYIGNYSEKYLYGNGVTMYSDTLILPNNVFTGVTLNNKIGNYSDNNHVMDTFTNNDIGDGFSKNLIQWDFKDNKILNDFYNNHVSNMSKPLVYFEHNTIGNGFLNNIITNSFTYNDVGDDFYGNTASSSFQQNKIGCKFYNNSISDAFLYNNIDTNFYNNAITKSFQQNRIGSKFYNNSILDVFLYNVVDLDFYSNVISGEFSNNLINGKFYLNDNKDGFKQNKIYCSFSENITDVGKSKLGFQYNIINYPVNGQDFSNSTHVSYDYTCTIIMSSDTKSYITYFDGSDDKYITPITT